MRQPSCIRDCREPIIHLQDYAALEILFHEASHAWDAKIATAIKTIAAEKKMVPPPELWHMVIFYTAGELTRAELSEVQIPDYIPYAYRNKLYERGKQQAECALKRHWLPFLEAKTDYKQALKNVVLHSADCK